MSAVAMDYFRRPRLSGNVLQHLQFATVHASVRRNDADNTSTVPYYPSLGAGASLVILIDNTSTFTATFASNGYQAVLTAINTALGSSGMAFDTDGSISIQTNTQGGTGAVEITGGTGAVTLGFGVNGTGVRSVGGDLRYTPEDRIGNESITGFPGPHEGLSVESLNRALGRVSSNSDVLFSEHVRDRAVMQKITGITVSSDGTYISLPSTARVFTGFGSLSNTSAPMALAPYFTVLDSVTKFPASSVAQALVRGTPSGSFPFSNSPNFADTSGKNVLGLNLAKFSAVAITNIQNGRYLECSGTTFTSSVVPGDVVTIAGATNTVPWNNNGLKWVVESVVSDTILNVRPMSQSEMALYGTTVMDEQPVIELNGNITGVQTYGTMTVSTGTFSQVLGATPSTGLNLVVSPPIPAGATVELWAAATDSIRKEQPGDLGNSEFPFVQTQVSTLFRHLPDALLNGFLPAFNSGPNTITFTGAALRLNGRLVFHPGKTYSNASTTFSLTQPTFFWYDPQIGDLGNGTSLPGGRTPDDAFLGNNTDPSIILLGATTVNGSAITGMVDLRRFETLSSRSITVGQDGQFKTLEGAAEFISTWAAQMGDTNSAEGDYAHWDISLVSDVSVTGTPTFNCTGIRISAANPATLLTFSSGSTGLSFGSGLNAFVMENFNVAGNGFTQNLATFTGGNVNVYVNNIQSSTNGGFNALFYNNGGAFNNFQLLNSTLFLNGGIVVGSFTGVGMCTVQNCDFQFNGTETALLPWFNGGLGYSGSFSCPQVVIENNWFIGVGFNPTNSTTWTFPTMGNFTPNFGIATIRGNTFEVTDPSNLSTSNINSLGNSLIIGVPTGNGKGVFVENNLVGEGPNFPVQQFVSAGFSFCNVTGNHIYARPEGSGAAIVTVQVESFVNDNYFGLVSARTGMANGNGIVSPYASNNYMIGNALTNAIVIPISGSEGVVEGNTYIIDSVTGTTVPNSFIQVNATGVNVLGNGYESGISSAFAVDVQQSGCNITGNNFSSNVNINATGCNISGTTGVGLTVTASGAVTVSGSNVGGVTVAAGGSIYLDGCTTGNISLAAGGTKQILSSNINGTVSMTFANGDLIVLSDNNISGAVTATGPSTSGQVGFLQAVGNEMASYAVTHNVQSEFGHNIVSGASTISAGQYTSNSWGSTLAVAVATITNQSVIFNGNVVVGAFTASFGSTIQASNNNFQSTVSISVGTDFSFTGNLVSGTFTANGPAFQVSSNDFASSVSFTNNLSSEAGTFTGNNVSGAFSSNATGFESTMTISACRFSSTVTVSDNFFFIDSSLTMGTMKFTGNVCQISNNNCWAGVDLHSMGAGNLGPFNQIYSNYEVTGNYILSRGGPTVGGVVCGLALPSAVNPVSTPGQVIGNTIIANNPSTANACIMAFSSNAESWQTGGVNITGNYLTLASGLSITGNTVYYNDPSSGTEGILLLLTGNWIDRGDNGSNDNVQANVVAAVISGNIMTKNGATLISSTPGDIRSGGNNVYSTTTITIS